MTERRLVSASSPSAADSLSGQKASCQAGNDIDGIDRRGHLGFRKLQLIEGQAQKQKQDTGQQVGDKQGTEQIF